MRVNLHFNKPQISLTSPSEPITHFLRLSNIFRRSSAAAKGNQISETNSGQASPTIQRPLRRAPQAPPVESFVGHMSGEDLGLSTTTTTTTPTISASPPEDRSRLMLNVDFDQLEGDTYGMYKKVNQFC